MMKNSPEESFRVCFDKKKWDTDKRDWVIVKVYGFYASPRVFFENLHQDGAANWGYEFITEGKRCNAYLDVEWYAVPDCDHNAMGQILKMLRAALMSKLGIDRAEIYVWCGSRETPNGYKNSFHIIIPTLHAASNKDLAHLFEEIWPNGFLIPGQVKSLIDMSVYSRNRPFRLPGCAKHGDDVSMRLITKDPYSDELSSAALPDADFKATERSLITVIDQDSTLLDLHKLTNYKAAFKSGKRKREWEGQTSGRATHRARVAQPHSSDATISPRRVEEVASVIVGTHPRIGSGYDEWFRTLCAIHNEAGRHSEVVLLAVEYSRIRESYRGASDVEGRLRDLQLRESGAKVTMASLVKWANENPALVFNMIENSSGLGPVEGAGVNKLWVNKLNQMLSWVDTARTSYTWLIQCMSYLAHHTELQMRSWVQQHYPQVSDEEFKALWSIETRSEYYEKALKTYVLQALEEFGAPQGKRARRERADMSSSRGAEPVVQDSEQTVQDADPMVQDSDPMVQDGTPPVPDAALTEAAAATGSSLTDPEPRKPPSPEPIVQDFEQMIRDFDFENLNEDNLAKVTMPICEKQLAAKMIDPSKDYIIQSGYGSGKTHVTHQYITENNLPVLSIVNLRSLKDGFVEKFADCNVLSYEDKSNFYKEYTKGRSVVITLDSLMMLEEVDFEAKDYVVFLDEIHSLMVYLSSSTTLAAKRTDIWPLLVRIIKNCKQFIAADNDICDVTVEFLLKLIQRDHDYEFVMNSYKSYGKVPATEIPTMKGVLTKMYRLICDNENFTACFNERLQSEQVHQELKARCEKDGIDPARLKLFTSKEGARITDIDEQWDGFCVFYSPIIVSGRDYKPLLPTTTFCLVRGTHTLSPEESAQQLARNRNIENLYFHLENVAAVTPRYKTQEAIKECFRTERKALKGMCVYREMCGRDFSECGDACEIKENLFTGIVCKVAHRRHLMESGWRHHFIKILTKKGFKLEESDRTPVGLGKEETKILDQRILEEKERKIEEFIVQVRDGVPVPSDEVFGTNALRHAKLLHLPPEEQVYRDYKCEVFEDTPFQQHLNFRRLTQSKEEFSNHFNAFIRGDFSFNATQTDVVRVAIFCDIIGKCVPDCSSILDLQVSLGPEDGVPVSKEILDLWKVLNRDNTTKVPENRKKLMQSLLNTGKNLFGQDYLDTRYTQPRKGGKKHRETYYTINPTWRDRQIALYRYSAHTQEGKLDSELAKKYGLLRAPDYSNPNKDVDAQIQERKNVDCKVQACEPMDYSKTLDSDSGPLQQQAEQEIQDRSRVALQAAPHALRGAPLPRARTADDERAHRLKNAAWFK